MINLRPIAMNDQYSFVMVLVERVSKLLRLQVIWGGSEGQKIIPLTCFEKKGGGCTVIQHFRPNNIMDVRSLLI